MTQGAHRAQVRAAAMKSAIAASFDNSADSYEQVGVEFFGPLGAELVRRAAPAVGCAALDLGCGRGHVLFPLAEAVGVAGAVVGVDLSQRMVQLCAVEAAARCLPQVRVSVGDAAAPDFPPASFDLVTAGMVMFFLPEPRPAVTNVATLLRPGGTFAMSSFGPSDAKFSAAMAILYRHKPGEPWEEATDKPFDSVDSIAAMLQAAGFVDVAVGEVEHQIRLRDLDHYWAWAGSHGGRILMDAVGPAALPAAKAEVYAMLTEHQGDDGSLIHHAVARFSLARTPAS
jgi:SAM-dependent methyltransferase